MSSSDQFEWQTSQSAYSGSHYQSTMSNVQQLDPLAESQAGPSTELSSNSSRSPLSRFGLGFLEGLSGNDKKSNRDGQSPKKRGPKRDSKPALTRRQQLNRQAQRTHRERKETYIKSLEEQCLQLKELCTESYQGKQAIEDENRKLKELLRMNGIHYNSREQSGSSGYPIDPTGVSSSSRSASAYAFASQSQQRLSPSNTQGSMLNSPSYGSTEYYGDQTALSSQSTLNPQSAVPSLLGSQSGLQAQQPQQVQQQQRQQAQQSQTQGGAQQVGNPFFNDQLAVDFVLDLEAACMDHLQYMCVRSNQDPEQPPSGHALMISCPPYSHIEKHPEVPYPHKTMDIPSSELMKLFQLSQNLPLDAEITPVKALNMIFNHQRFNELTLQDFQAIREDLKMKTRCYGFGAVLEEFELEDAMNSVLATKQTPFT